VLATYGWIMVVHCWVEVAGSDEIERDCEYMVTKLGLR